MQMHQQAGVLLGSGAGAQDVQLKQAYGQLNPARPVSPFQATCHALAQIVMSSEGSARRLENILIRLRGHVPAAAPEGRMTGGETVGADTPVLRLLERGGLEARANLQRVSAMLDELENLIG